jgi:hypothetical protein
LNVCSGGVLEKLEEYKDHIQLFASSDWRSTVVEIITNIMHTTFTHVMERKLDRETENISLVIP